MYWTAKEIEKKLLTYFKLEPTEHQADAFRLLSNFLAEKRREPVFILRGAAGTGKTTMLRACVKTLDDMEANAVLLAPTGRAAKVLASKTGRAASTIHKYIYAVETSLDGRLLFEPVANEDPEPTVYIVDEASMINDERGEGKNVSSHSLLFDLLQFAFGDNGDYKIIFVGDPAQLPPVGAVESPALSDEYLCGAQELAYAFNLSVDGLNMTQVKRQALESGILRNATILRAALASSVGPLPTLYHAQDVHVVEEAEQVIEAFLDNYTPDDLENVVIICHSNAMAARLNQAIRGRLYDEPEPLQKGDVVMVVKNHYRKRYHALPFIANGEIGVVEAAYQETLETRFDQQWMDVEISFLDSDAILETKIPIGLLTAKESALSYAQTQNVWQTRRLELLSETGSAGRADLQKDPYVNCLQLKFGYAVTAHKAQGGQWANVIVVFEPYLYKDISTPDGYTAFLRWTYTAFTRATENLFIYRSPYEFIDEE